MTATRWTAVALAASIWLAQTPVTPQQQQPTFRAVGDVVPITVSVMSGRTYVTGLGVPDFELVDNGVRQDITSVSADALSVDVTVVVDTSGSVVRSLGQFRSDVKKIADQLKPDEQLQIVTFERAVRQILPMQPVPRRLPVEEIKNGDTTSLLDAIVFALARAPRPDRRHLIFVFTDGNDNASLMGYDAIPTLAGRTDAVLHIVLVKVSGVPADPSHAAFDALELAAARSGGHLYPPADQAPDIVNAFKQALDGFRRSYVIYFTPKGVAREGWHDVAVRVTRPGTYDVLSRKGYFGG